ncbi:glycosyltransferase [Carnobacterium divergens]|uniref:Glycosyltransferase n=1 Tax=Carnobacterium divergens TaxID=2748 RepID=A0AAW8R7X4_CARDV|nr:glycosyltransferase [Carnobacterium divergens]MDT1958275.1 glycosyltransferase [Carnobacterium divergens]MDT1973542.1 glycosyltransferase [Carnobacterium divergens]MDT2011505.1 glycosyltransferase [Carnobacterium divergens]
MKIMFLAAGNSIHTIRWVNTLARRDHDVYLVFLANQKPELDLISEEVKQYQLKFGGNVSYYTNALELRKIVNKVKPDIVNAHYASGYGTLARMARVRPLVLSVWGSDVYDFPYKNSFSMNLVKKNLNYANEIASTSIAMSKQVEKLLGTDDRQITITPFGVDLSAFDQVSKNTKKEIITIGIIKTLAPKYGILDLIKAFKLLKKRNLPFDIQLLIYGDGPEKMEQQNLINQNQLNNSVFLMGRIANTEVPRVLKTFDIFCVTSVLNSESFGVSAVEAMAASLPVVATNVDGFMEVVDDGVTGIIVKKKDAVSIANGLEKLILDANLRNTMGKAGYERVIKEYKWFDNVNVMERLYRKVID